MILKKVIFVSFCIFLFLLSHQNIFACSCGTRPTVLDEFESSKLVIVAKAVSVEGIKPEEVGIYQENIKSTKWIVEKVYKGNVKVGDELTFGQGNGSDCGMIFDQKILGNQFIFYINKRSIDSGENGRQIYYVSFCGKSTSLKSAENDLLFLDNLDKLRGRTRVSGEISCFRENCPSPANVEITFTGENKTFTTKTDKKGFYQIYDLPAGTYLIEVKLQRGWKADDDEYDLSRYNNGFISYYGQENLKEPLKNQFYIGLSNKGHIEFDFFVVPDNSIRGKVFSPVGKPMPDVCISALASETKESTYGGYSCTKENGEYLIENLSPGNYFLVVNNDGKVSSKEPFGKVFYPGTFDKNNASLVLLEPGKFLNEINIQIPKTTELIEISGRFLYSDGSPVADRSVEFTPFEQSGETDGKSSAKTDDQGRFSMKTLKGLRGSVSAKMYVSTSNSKFENCPEALKVLEELGERYSDIKTNEIEVSGDESMQNLKLTLPFPNCAK